MSNQTTAKTVPSKRVASEVKPQQQGLVKVENDDGRLRLRFSHSGKRY